MLGQSTHVGRESLYALAIYTMLYSAEVRRVRRNWNATSVTLQTALTGDKIP